MMPKTFEKISDQRLTEAYHRAGGNITKMADALGMGLRNLRRRCLDLGLQGRGREKGVEFSMAPIPSMHRSVQDLLLERKAKFAQRAAHEKAAALRKVKVNIAGPVAIHHFGDPHVDDDGTDIAAIERHVDLINKTPGMFGGNVGDTTNNWVGRLARLYANQSTTADEAWQLAEWFVKSTPWLYMIAGNHDMWSGAGDPLKWICSNPDAYSASAVRFELDFPNGRKVRVNARHDFAGASMWNPAHGSMKAAQIGMRDHLMVNGHRHMSGYGVVKDPTGAIVSHCIQVASYKVFDTFAKERGFRDQHISPCAVTVIDPDAKTEASLIQMFWDPEPAAEYLTYLRKSRKL